VARRIIVASRAEAQIGAIDAWWRSHREDSPGLFARELGEAFSTISVAPDTGSHYPHPEVKGIRRIHLRVTRHHVYYLAGTEALVVLAVWGSVKGAGPNLNDIE
jgi:plasmid stabilization system protein ParE